MRRVGLFTGYSDVPRNTSRKATSGYGKEKVLFPPGKIFHFKQRSSRVVSEVLFRGMVSW
jgi:hypothetical protein